MKVKKKEELENNIFNFLILAGNQRKKVLTTIFFLVNPILSFETVSLQIKHTAGGKRVEILDFETNLRTKSHFQ